MNLLKTNPNAPIIHEEEQSNICRNLYHAINCK